MIEKADLCRDGWLTVPSGDSGKLAHYDPRGLIVIALMPPRAAFDPPAILALVVEQRAASAAHVILEPYLRILLHIHLDCVPSAVVP
jgi:hypothetical protein